jgi:hypothetical protein
MGIIVKSKTAENEPVPPGNYLGVIVGLYDVGTQEGPYGSRRQIITITELHRKRGPATDSKGRPLTIPSFYSLTFGSMNGKKSKLRTDVETITGHVFSDEEAERDGFDVQGLVGLAYRLTVVPHTNREGKPTGKIGAIMMLDDDDIKPQSQADEVFYELDPREPIPTIVPKWIARFIERSKEWVEIHGKPRADAEAAKTPTSTTPVPVEAWGDAPPF